MHIRHHQKDSCLRHFVGLRFKNPDTVAEVTLLQSWLRRYVIWNGCRKRHCLEDGLITQNASARSELLRSVADVYIFKLVLQSCPSRGQSLAGMRQLQLALKNGRKLLEQHSKVQIMHLVNWCFIALNLNTNQSWIQMHHQLSWLDGSWNLDLALADGAEKTLEHFADPLADGLEQQDSFAHSFH